MISMSKDHPDFDLALELLCTLPHENVAKAQIADLVRDLGVNEAEIMDLVKNIRAKGLLADITLIKSTGDVLIFINEFDWNKVKVEAGRYWKKVYGTC